MRMQLATRLALIGSLTLSPALGGVLAFAPMFTERAAARETSLAGDALYTVVPRDGERLESITPEEVAATRVAGGRLAETRFLHVDSEGERRLAQFEAGDYFEALGIRIEVPASGVVVSDRLARAGIARKGGSIVVGATVLPVVGVAHPSADRAFGDGLRTDLWVSREQLGRAVMGDAAASAPLEREVRPVRFVAASDGAVLVRLQSAATANQARPFLVRGISGDANRRLAERRRAANALVLCAILLVTGAFGMLWWAYHERDRLARNFAIRRALGAGQADLRRACGVAGLCASVVVAASMFVWLYVVRRGAAAVGVGVSDPSPALFICALGLAIVATAGCAVGIPRPPRASTIGPTLVWRPVILFLQVSAAAMMIGCAGLLIMRASTSATLDGRLAASGLEVAVATAASPDTERDLARGLLMRTPSPESISATLTAGSWPPFALVDRDPLSPAAGSARFFDASGRAIDRVRPIAHVGITREYFEVMTLGVRDGSLAAFAERGSDAAVVSESVARRLCGERRCIGEPLLVELDTIPPQRSTWRVAAVVEDFAVAGGRLGHAEAVYLPIGFAPISSIAVVARDRGGLPRSFTREAAALFPAGTSLRFGSVAERIATARRPDHALLEAMCAVALAVFCVALVSVFTTVSSLAHRQRWQTGIRMAVGASRWQAIRPPLAGVAATLLLSALVGAVAAGPAVEAIAHGTPGDASTWAIAVGTVALVVAASSVAAAWSMRGVLKASPASLIACAFLVGATPAWAEEARLLRFAVPISGPAAEKIVPSQLDLIEAYPTLYVIDGRGRLVDVQERWPAIVEMLDRVAGADAGGAASAASIESVPSICLKLRLRNSDEAQCTAAIASPARTFVLLTATSCPPCKNAEAALERRAARAAANEEWVLVEHRPTPPDAAAPRTPPHTER